MKPKKTEAQQRLRLHAPSKCFPCEQDDPPKTRSPPPEADALSIRPTGRVAQGDTAIFTAEGHHCHSAKVNSATGTRARVARVRAEYPNQLDYSGCDRDHLVVSYYCT